jgi:hypothetical protein
MTTPIWKPLTPAEHAAAQERAVQAKRDAKNRQPRKRREGAIKSK